MEITSIVWVVVAIMVAMPLVYGWAHRKIMSAGKKHEEPKAEKWEWRTTMPMTQAHIDAYEIMKKRYLSETPDVTLVGYLPFYAILITIMHFAAWLLGDFAVGFIILLVVLSNEGLMVIRGYRGYHFASAYRLVVLGSMSGHTWAAMTMLVNAIIASSANKPFIAITMAVMWLISIVGRQLGKTIVRHIKEVPRSLLA